MLIPPRDQLIVRMEKAFEDELLTSSGVKLFKDTTMSPEWSVSCTGEVVSVPNTLSQTEELKGLDIEVKPHDTVIFSYMVVYAMDLRDRDTPLHKNLFYYEGNFYWRVDYYHLLGHYRDEKIIPAQGYVICEPPEVKPLNPLTASGLWLPDMVVKKKPKGIAKVVGVGNPRKGEPRLDLKEGDTIRFNEELAFKYNIKGKDYIILKHPYILAKIENPICH